MSKKCAVIIPAAGSGKRMGGIKKQFLEIDSTPVLIHTIKVFEKVERVGLIVVAIPQDELEYCQSNILSKETFNKEILLVAGGEERQDSVYNALKNVSDYDIVIVHDAVRPFVTADIVDKSIDAAIESGAAVVAIPETDTIKQVDADGHICGDIDREGVWRMQTPQTFRREILDEAISKGRAEGILATDESSLVRNIGVKVKIVQGSAYNIKITLPEDIPLGEAIAKSFLT